MTVFIPFGAKARFSLAVALAGLVLVGCSPGPGDVGVAVVDLAAVAKATGQDQVISRQLEAARLDLANQLTQIAGDLEQQLQAEQSRRGGAAAAAKEADFQQLAAQARQQFAQTQALAQQKAQEFQVGLAQQYRQAVQPVAAEIARDQGAGVILVSDATLLWFDSAVDITDEVIAELRANPIAFPAAAEAGADQAGPAAPSATDPGAAAEQPSGPPAETTMKEEGN